MRSLRVAALAILPLAYSSVGCEGADAPSAPPPSSTETVQADLSFSLPSLTQITCTAAKLNPYYWDAYAGVAAAKASGLLRSLQDCLNGGDLLGDLSIPTGVAKNCLCNEFSWPPPGMPTCPEAHSVCSTGAALTATMPTSGCVNNPDSTIAVAVCEADSFCCNNSWDSTCVSEVANVFWQNPTTAEAQIIQTPGITCDAANAREAQMESDAKTVASALSCIGTRTGTYSPTCETRRGRGAF